MDHSMGTYHKSPSRLHADFLAHMHMAPGSSSFELVATYRDKASVSGASCHSRSARGSSLRSILLQLSMYYECFECLKFVDKGIWKGDFYFHDLRKSLGYNLSTALVRYYYIVTARRTVDATLEEHEKNHVDVQ